jgi:hypothetical protein
MAAILGAGRRHTNPYRGLLLILERSSGRLRSSPMLKRMVHWLAAAAVLLHAWALVVQGQSFLP